MKQTTPFVISEFTNPSGKIVFQLYARIDGQRFRKNFRTRAEAEAERQVQEVNWLQRDTGTRAAITRLNEDQLHEAEAVFRRLAAHPRSLSFYVDFALANYREPEKQKPMADAVADYIAAKEHEFAQDQLSPPQMGRIRWELKRLVKAFPGKAVAELTAPALTQFLEKDRAGMKTHNNRRGVLSTFFKYSFQRGWIADNPIPKVPHYRIRRKRGMAQTLTAAQAATLMEYLETTSNGRLVPYFALCLFAGIRPGVPHGEITKLKPEAVDLDAGVIHISAEVSKVREPRKIAIQPNLAAWLRAYPLKRFPIVAGNFQKRRAKFAEKFNLTHDVLRHTFISMFVAKFRSIGEAAIQAGNSESIIRKHYLDLKTTKEADGFFGILPKHAGSIVAEDAAATPATDVPSESVAA
ncbi:MAG: site-specific integrase [Opitutaceae bacterium]|nr:site-specific integrase [Opitutaceae bacterium]